MKPQSLTTRLPSRLARVALLLVLAASAISSNAAAPRQLRVSENRRFLVSDDGRPFFYLGDTAWELFHRLNREQARAYLENRARKGFTVIQAVALAELDGLHDPNPYGHRPLIGDDPTKPDVKDGPANDFWDHVDEIVHQANALGLTMGFLPSWGDKWNKKWGAGPEIFNPANAEAYGEWLGRRYANASLIWILGGDRPVETDAHKEIIRAMARGVHRGDGGRHLITFHPVGGDGSARLLHDEPWLDFNMRQNGHADDSPFAPKTYEDYARTPIKPVIDGEPIYEDHPVAFKASERGYSVAADTRRPLYWDLFAGAFGHTYGNHAVWQMYAPERKPINGPLMPWYEAIDQPGAGQMQFGRWLLESRPFLSRIPDNSVIVPGTVTNAVPGAGLKRLVATRDAQGRYAMVYAPAGRAFRVRMNAITGASVRAWWFNPRNGQASAIGEFPNTGEREFSPPDPGENLDWVLVLDDAGQGFTTPGQRPAPGS
jgi:hypothetical protein